MRFPVTVCGICTVLRARGPPLRGFTQRRRCFQIREAERTTVFGRLTRSQPLVASTPLRFGLAGPLLTRRQSGGTGVEGEG